MCGTCAYAHTPWKFQFPCWTFLCIPILLSRFLISIYLIFFLSVSLYLHFPLPSLNSSACLCPFWGHWSFLSGNFGSFYPSLYLLAPLSSVGEELSFWGSHVALLYFTCVCIVVCTSSGKSSGFIWESCWAAYSVFTPTERGSKWKLPFPPLESHIQLTS